MSFHNRAFTVAITFISRALILRDRMRGVFRSHDFSASSSEIISRHAIPSGPNILDAVFVKPIATAPRAAVLICHGIAEVVEHWIGVQRLLASEGVASLVFNYSGYGKSTGHVDWGQCERDAIAAFVALQSLAPGLPITLLGFSLGSGIAAAVVNDLPADRLLLCGAFTSFRKAARSIGLPAFLSSWVPPIWSAREQLSRCRLPVLIVHGEKDRMFPLEMARELVSYCGGNAELIVMPGVKHSEPYYKPKASYWGRLFPA